MAQDLKLQGVVEQIIFMVNKLALNLNLNISLILEKIRFKQFTIYPELVCWNRTFEQQTLTLGLSTRTDTTCCL